MLETKQRKYRSSPNLRACFASLLLAVTAAACSEPAGQVAKSDASDVSDTTGDVQVDVAGPDLGGQLDAQQESDTLDFDLWFGPEKACDSPGSWGCSCTSDANCNSNFCIDSDMGKICTKTCMTNCPENWYCVAHPTATTLYVCVPQPASLCKPCEYHADCETPESPGLQLCVPFSTESNGVKRIHGSFCGSSCDTDNDCKADYKCETVTVLAVDGVTPITAKQCLPVPGPGGERTCPCNDAWASTGAATSCSIANQHGTCKAKRVCAQSSPAHYQLTLCAASPPTPESCDGQDNNCDGQTDEANATGCTVFYDDSDGDFYGAGVGECLCADPGIGFTSNPGDCNDWDHTISPSAKESCDQIDNDCNGKTDDNAGC
jgi:hypothetical protein